MVQPHLGEQLRKIRSQRRCSIADVARGTGLSASFLKLLEQGKSDIAIGRLMRLTSYYGVGLADVLPHPESGNPEVIRAGRHRRLPSEDEHLEVLLLSHDGNRAIRPVLVTYEVGGSTSDYLRQDGDVFIYVLAGEVTLEIEGRAPIVLGTGDTAYLASGTPRKYLNAGGAPATMIGVLAQDPRESLAPASLDGVSSLDTDASTSPSPT